MAVETATDFCARELSGETTIPDCEPFVPETAEDFRQSFTREQAEGPHLDYDRLQLAGKADSWIADRERTVIATAICYPELAHQATCKPQDFLEPFYAEMWAIISGLIVTKGKHWTVADVFDSLPKQLESNELLDGCFSDSWPRSFAGIAESVRKAGHERRLKRSMLELAQGDFSGREFLDMASRVAANVVPGTQASGTLLGDTMGGFIDEVLSGEVAKDIYLPTGLRELDEKTNGLQRSVMSIIAGRPSLGKSSLTATVARNVALAGYTVDYYSLEDSLASLRRRFVSQESGIDSRRLIDGNLTREQREQLTSAAKRLYEAKGSILICDSRPGAFNGLVSMILTNAESRRTDLIVVDYVQLLRDESQNWHGNRNAELTQISNRLGEVAKESGAAMLLASQLRRVEGREEPELTDLRDCGSLEQDAFLVGFLWRPSKLHFREGEDQATLFKVAKNKDGATGQIVLHWRPECVFFGDASEELKECVRLMSEGARPATRRSNAPAPHWTEDN
jgi:replicative DNA helicase